MNNLKQRKARVLKLIAKLKELFGNPKPSLKFKNNLELLVAVILSAQCTDKRVNEVTKELFKKYKNVSDYADANLEEFEKDIKPTGFYKAKAKNILAMANILRAEHKGRVPKTIEELVKLPGVGRKTANVVLHKAFGITSGIAVDTHARRFAKRFDLTDSDNPVQIEKDLMEIVPRGDWGVFTNLAIEYGRNIAPARKYDTTKDPLIKIYPKAAEGWRRT